MNTIKVNPEQKVIFEKDKGPYPTTYIECCKILNNRSIFFNKLDGYKWREFNALRQVIICRDAYWKLANNYKPNWADKTDKYCIIVHGNTIGLHTYLNSNAKLAFPTSEMQEAFYNNFSDLIEKCKNLL